MAKSSETNVAEFSVSDIAFAVKRMVEDSFGYVRVRGEISGFRGQAASGHCYFTLKDEKARLDSVIWRGTFMKLKVKPEEGLEVIATGRLTTFPGSSKYQIVVESLEPAGVGALMALLEERKKKLAAEGLFDEARKQKLPYLPRTIGVVTSPTGAVIRDIVHRLSDRFPVRVVVWPVRVQGESSADEVTKAIKGFNALEAGDAVPRPDLIIVARGGGSIEDLWSFNEENVARAAAASDIPLISAVGHETDWTLIDFVSDLRAPTPTGAAEMAVPVRHELVASVGDLERRLENATLRHVDRCRTSLRGLERALPSLKDLMALPRQRLDAAGERLSQALLAGTALHKNRFSSLAARMNEKALTRMLVRHREVAATLSARMARAGESDVGRRRQRLDSLAARLDPRLLQRPFDQKRSQTTDLGRRGSEALLRLVSERRRSLASLSKLMDAFSFENVLRRGFAIVRSGEGEILRSAAGVSAGDALNVQFSDGVITAQAGEALPGAPADTGGLVPRKSSKPRKKAAKAKAPEGQGSLF